MAFTLLPTSAYSSLDATKLSGNLPALNGSSLTNLPDNSNILQVVSAQYTNTVNNNTGDEYDTGLNAAITPASTDNKILILCTCPYSVSTSTDRSDVMGGLDIWADKGGAGYNKISGSGSFAEDYSLGYSDAAESAERRNSGRWASNMMWSPSTTSECTIKLYSHNNEPNQTISAHYDSRSHLILMEVKG